jgi:pimeloyl-ACP methyl ester carboxylesterase
MTIVKTALAGILAGSLAGPAMADATNVVLVHGATMDGSGWRAVYDILHARGLTVRVVQLPHTSLADDIEATRLALRQQQGSTVLVGHSYGGAVITEAGSEANVKALVYVAALQPDGGETLSELSKRYPMKIDMKMLGKDRFVPDPASYHGTIAADLPRSLTDFMSASSKPMPLEAFEMKFGYVAWRHKPSFAIVAMEDRVISPDLARWMYQRAGAKTTDITSSHMVYISHPEETAAVIMQAIEAVE